MTEVTPQIELRCGDCLQLMGDIPDGSIDLIACDLPYGTTACAWDVIIPFEPLWVHYKRLLKPRGAVVLTASQPFTSMLVMSNQKWFKYSLVWDQRCTSGQLNAKRMPLRAHQDILVFYKILPTYNPQMTLRSEAELKRLNRKPASKDYSFSPQVYQPGVYRVSPDRVGNRLKHPNSVIRISAREKRSSRGFHPTQKPVALMEYLIRTYSNEGDIVLDNAMGSGTTPLACFNTGRHCIGIDNNPDYIAIAEKRLADARNSTPLFAG